MSMLSSPCWGMLHGLCQTSAGESRSHHLIRFLDKAVILLVFFCAQQQLLNLLFFSLYRLSLLFQHLHDLSTPMMRKFSLTHAGLFHTYLMALMTKSKLWLKLVCVPALWSSSCMWILHTNFMLISSIVCCLRWFLFFVWCVLVPHAAIHHLRCLYLLYELLETLSLEMICKLRLGTLVLVVQ